MLKNLDLTLPETLSRSLDGVVNGDWIAVVSPHHETLATASTVHESLEQVVAALVTVTTLHTDAPIVIEGEDDLDDSAYAVLGLSADASGRRIEGLQVSELAFSALLKTARSTIVIDSPESFGFLLCKGRC
ncbi:hypothetical protein [Humibacter albus]|uniref:hypothetical protein n=1 Tax=Humibacter albus TaxID=427754 RepID=UPI0003B6FCB5|nr:hypothetical protein [Humibacter albus]